MEFLSIKIISKFLNSGFGKILLEREWNRIIMEMSQNTIRFLIGPVSIHTNNIKMANLSKKWQEIGVIN